MKYCKYCGRQAYDDARFCTRCGKPFSPSSVPDSNAAAAANETAVAAVDGTAENSAGAVKREGCLHIVGFILSFLSGIAGFFVCLFSFMQASKQKLPPHGLAIAGLIISIIRLILLTAYIVMLIVASVAVYSVFGLLFLLFV